MAKYAITSLRAKNFGPMSDVSIEFSEKLNVITGDNGMGKSQLLKLLYSCANALNGESLTKSGLNKSLADKLIGVFMPESLGRLASRIRGRSKAEIRMKLKGIGEPLAFDFSSAAKAEVKVSQLPSTSVEDTAVFLPSRELLSIYPGLAALYDTREVEFDETWRDTALLLSRAPLKGPRGELANEILTPIFEVLEGTVVEEKGRFYVRLKSADSGSAKIEAPLVSEGFRKLAMIVRLVQSGVLLEGGYLFWDEPEANLNPSTQKAVARAIVALARSGTQVFVATHSVFLIRELTMILETLEEQGNSLDSAFVGLHLESGEGSVVSGVTASVADDPSGLPSIVAMEEEAEQSYKYLGL